MDPVQSGRRVPRGGPPRRGHKGTDTRGSSPVRLTHKGSGGFIEVEREDRHLGIGKEILCDILGGEGPS